MPGPTTDRAAAGPGWYAVSARNAEKSPPRKNPQPGNSQQPLSRSTVNAAVSDPAQAKQPASRSRQVILEWSRPSGATPSASRPAAEKSQPVTSVYEARVDQPNQYLR